MRASQVAKTKCHSRQRGRALPERIFSTPPPEFSHLVKQLVSFGIDLRQFSECFVSNETNLVAVLKEKNKHGAGYHYFPRL